MPRLSPEHLPDVEYQPHNVWAVIVVSIAIFWILCGVNALLIFMFTKPDSPSGLLAGVASVGEIIIAAVISLEDILGALLIRAGVSRKDAR
jgi:hypothetical protein